MPSSKIIRHIPIVSMLALAVAACSTVAKDGPTGDQVRSASTTELTSTDPQTPYAVVDVTAEVIRIANACCSERSSFAGLPAGDTNPAVRLVPGDVVTISVFEGGPGGLFSSSDPSARGGNATQLGEFQVGNDGTVAVPFAGRVKVGGLTPADAGAAISAKLVNRAIEPQTVVAVKDRKGGAVYVTGDVKKPAQFDLDPTGARVLSAVVRAEGTNSPANEEVVSIQRRGAIARARLDDIQESSRLNVALAAGDTVIVTHQPRTFMAFGATRDATNNNSRSYTIDHNGMTLAEALARAGGLASDRSDAGAVFLVRFEEAASLGKMGVDVTRFGEARVPTFYAIDLRRPGNLFLTNSLTVRDKDIIFVADSPSVDYLKFMGILEKTTTPFYNITMSAKSR